MLAVIIFLAYRIEQIAQQFPVTAVIDAQHAFGLVRELVKPRDERRAQRLAREHSIRILTELGQYRSPYEFTATRAIIVRSLAVELAAIVGYQRNAHETTVDKIGDFRVHEKSHALPR